MINLYLIFNYLILKFTIIQFHTKKSNINKTYIQTNLHFIFKKKLPKYLNNILKKNKKQLTPTNIKLT